MEKPKVLNSKMSHISLNHKANKCYHKNQDSLLPLSSSPPHLNGLLVVRCKTDLLVTSFHHF